MSQLGIFVMSRCPAVRPSLVLSAGLIGGLIVRRSFGTAVRPARSYLLRQSLTTRTRAAVPLTALSIAPNRHMSVETAHVRPRSSPPPLTQTIKRPPPLPHSPTASTHKASVEPKSASKLAEAVVTAAAAPSPSLSQSPSPLSSVSPAAAAAAATAVMAASTVPLTRWQALKARVMKEVRHYWFGTKLLWKEAGLARQLVIKKLNGGQLDRREQRQLTRTAADMLRLIPFAVLIIVPFGEFVIPIILRFFPNFLPSTYVDHQGEEIKLQKQLAAKIEMAQFLQETTTLMAQQILQKKKEEALLNSASPVDAAAAAAAQTAATSAITTAKNFTDFMAKIRRGESTSNAEIVHFSSLFDDEFTMENLKHEQLAAIAGLLGIKVFGSDWVLRYKINQKLKELREDDKMIAKDGVDSLTLSELQEACRARGIYPGTSMEYMRRKISDWLELSLSQDVPITLLILSRAFSSKYSSNIQADLASTLKHIPDAVVTDAQTAQLDRTDDPAEKLKLLDEEQKLAQEQVKTQSTATAVAQTASAVTAKTKKTAAPAPPAVAVGLPEIKSKLKEIAEDNDEVEEDIDEAVGDKQPLIKPQTQQPIAVDATRAATSAPAATAPAAEKVLDHSTVKKVDRLNDRVESLIKDIQAQVAQAESKKQQSTTPTTSPTP